LIAIYALVRRGNIFEEGYLASLAFSGVFGRFFPCQFTRTFFKTSSPFAVFTCFTRRGFCIHHTLINNVCYFCVKIETENSAGTSGGLLLGNSPRKGGESVIKRIKELVEAFTELLRVIAEILRIIFRR